MYHKLWTLLHLLEATLCVSRAKVFHKDEKATLSTGLKEGCSLSHLYSSLI